MTERAVLKRVLKSSGIRSLIGLLAGAALIAALTACTESPDLEKQPQSVVPAPGVDASIKPAALVNPVMEYLDYSPAPTDLVLSRQAYIDKLYGFWLGQCIANWTGLVTIASSSGLSNWGGTGAELVSC